MKSMGIDPGVVPGTKLEKDVNADVDGDHVNGEINHMIMETRKRKKL